MLVSRPGEQQVAVPAVSVGWMPAITGGAIRSALVWPILSLCIAAGLRFWQLGHNSLWADEFASLATALPPLSQIPAAALRHDAFEPPLYFWLLHGVIRMFGGSDWALRLISAVAGTLTVPLAWLLVRDLSRSVSLAGTAALLLAVNPLHVWYSQEARPYALVVCLGTAALLCLARALDRDHAGWWIGFAVLSAAAILCHVTGVVYLLVGAVWALYARGPRGLARIAVAGAGAFVLTLPFLLTLLHAIRHATGTGSPERPLTGLEVPYSLFTYVAGYSFGPPVREIQDLGWKIALANHWLQSLLAGLLLLGLAILIARTRRSGVIYFAALLICALAATLVGSLVTTKSYNVRYVLPGLVGFLGLVAAALDGLSPAARRVGLAVVLGMFGWADVQWFTSSLYWKEDSRTAAGCLVRELPPGSTVAVAPSYMQPLLLHYAPKGAGLRFVAVTDSATLAMSRPKALAITRLYHLLVPEAALVRAFEAQAGAHARVGRAVGYRLYFSSPPAGDTTGSCRLSDLGTP